MQNESKDVFSGNGRDNDTQKLIEILGEILFLRDRLAQLEEEAERLKEDLGH